MTLKSIGEFGFIKRISRGCLVRPQEVVRAIGDDAAAFRTRADHLTLVTTDLLVERVHFLRHAGSPRDLGHKALAVNLSDIAAMGGSADHAFISLGAPDDLPLAYLDDLYAGLKSLAQCHQVNILGGDTTSSKKDLILNIAVIGSVAADEMLCRHTANAGDVVVSTGTLGDSRAGLNLILDGVLTQDSTHEALLGAHLRPNPHLAEGRFLASFGGVTAAIDVSDGLSSDLGHIADESALGYRLKAEAIPRSEALNGYCAELGRDGLEWATDGGEDYCLIACVKSSRVPALCRAFEEEFSRPLFILGEMTREHERLLIWPDGKTQDLAPRGWDHFRQ